MECLTTTMFTNVYVLLLRLKLCYLVIPQLWLISSHSLVPASFLLRTSTISVRCPLNVLLWLSFWILMIHLGWKPLLRMNYVKNGAIFQDLPIPLHLFQPEQGLSSCTDIWVPILLDTKSHLTKRLQKLAPSICYTAKKESQLWEDTYKIPKKASDDASLLQS